MPFWTSTDALFTEEFHAHLIVIGCSVIELEIAKAYRRLGREVTVRARHTLLYREEPLLGENLRKCFEKGSGLLILMLLNGCTQTVLSSNASTQHVYQSGAERHCQNAGRIEYQTYSASQLKIQIHHRLL